MSALTVRFVLFRRVAKGHDRAISEAGKQYTIDLPRYLEHASSVLLPRQNISGTALNFLVLTGTTQAHEDTVARLRLRYPCYSTPLIDELRGGNFHGMSRDEIRKHHPEEFYLREANKLHYRYPGVGGESYLDVIERVRPIIIELERQRQSVLLVSHMAVL
eukprot:gene6073-7752_t